MAKKWINEETPIGVIIMKKGKRAEKLIDSMICGDEKGCSLGTTVKLGAAVNLRKKNDLLPDILSKLNNLPDIPCRR